MKRLWKRRWLWLLPLACLVFVGTPAWIVDIGVPLHSAAAAVGENWRGAFSFLTDSAVRRENEVLQREVTQLRAQQVELERLRNQNARYRGLLNLQEQHPDYRFAAVRIIAVDAASGFDAFTVSGGARVGVAVGDPVVTADGMLGVIYEVSATAAKARSILDPRAPIGVCIARTEESGITAGAAEGLLRVERLERTAGVRAGDYVVTYGNGGYPAGLLLGEVTAVRAETDGLSLSATVRPFAVVREADEVFVLIDHDEAKE